ncbi:MAG: ASPIC/UnbV domain-containing protein [Saprospiraceae bacterium]|nr:ASPIC/UnbV domain-containing protein [Candidatus Vicinibacter affinis]
MLEGISTSELSIHFGLGASNKVDSLLIRWPSGKSMKIYNPKINQNLLFKEADAKDFFESQFNQTIKKVLSVEITSELLQGIQHKENMFDDYAREILLPYKMSTLGPCLDIGDVNNDQLTDFYLGGSSNLDGQLFLQNEFGGFIKSEFGPKVVYKMRGS